MKSKTLVKPLVNRDGAVIGRTERDRASGIVTPFWYPKPRTMALPAQEPDQKWRCPQCLTYLPIELDDTGQYIPCTACGYAEWRGPSAAGTKSIPATAVPVSFSVPDTLSRAVALQREPHLVAEAHPVPVQMALPAPQQPRETYAPRTTTLDAVVAYQVAQGLRDPGPQRLHTSATVRCPRCNAPDFRTCACPPTPPDTLAIAVQRNQERDQRQAAALLAAHPKLEHWD